MPELTLKIRTPKIPVIVTVDIPKSMRGTNKNDVFNICVADLTDDQLEDMGREWTSKLIEVARRVRHMRKKKANSR